MSPTLRVGELYDQLRDALELERVPGTEGLDHLVPGADVSSPGLALAGFVARFASERLQVFGETEVTYLHSLNATTRREHLAQFFSFPVPCVFVTKGLELDREIVDEARNAGIAVLRSTGAS